MAKAIALLCCAAVAVIVGFYTYAARNEVVYLCGNFSPGVAFSSVTRQLDTAELSVYSVDHQSPLRPIQFSSILHLHRLQCHILFDENGRVIDASHRWTF